MNVVSAVANLQKERDYYKECTEELQAVVKQITEGPGEVELIHPLDLGEMLNDLKIVDVYKNEKVITLNLNTPAAKKYKQSIFAPRKLSALV